MSPLRVTPLVCPNCSLALFGLRYDRVFICNRCADGLLVGEFGWERYPLKFAAAQVGPDDRPLHLPMWRMEVAIKATAANSEQKVAIKKVGSQRVVWVTGFTLVRPSYYGDLGLLYTEKEINPPALERAPHRAFLAGCANGPAEARRYAELFITLILDKRSDVTGLELEIEPTSIELWAIPFFDRGDKIMDALTGTELPAFAVDDLSDLRRLREKAAG